MKALVKCNVGSYVFRDQQVGAEGVEFDLSDAELEQLQALGPVVEVQSLAGEAKTVARDPGPSEEEAKPAKKKHR